MNLFFVNYCLVYGIIIIAGTDARDVGEMRMDESVVLKTISDRGIGPLEECRPLFNCIYGRGNAADASDASDSDDDASDSSGPVRSGQLQLNEAQSRAVRLYADAAGPRVFCIRSPPGSGKTTVGHCGWTPLNIFDFND